MRAFPSEVGVFRGDRLACTAAANCATLIVSAVRADRYQWIHGLRAIASIEGEVKIFARIAHLSAVQRLGANAGLRDEPPPSWRGRPTAMLSYRSDPHLGRFDPTDNGPSELGIDDGRRLKKGRMSPAASQFEQHPGRSGRGRAVHRVVAGQRLVAARLPLDNGHPLTGTTTASRSSRRISTVASTRSRPGNAPASAASPR